MLRRQEAPPATTRLPPKPTKSRSAWTWAWLREEVSKSSMTIAWRPVRKAALVGKACADGKRVAEIWAWRTLMLRSVVSELC